MSPAELEEWVHQDGWYDGWRDRYGRNFYHPENDRLRLAYWFGYAEGREERRRRFTTRYGWWVDVVGWEPGERRG